MYFDYNFLLFKGMSPRQVSYEYRVQEQRTLIGFGLYYRDKNDKIECLNIDLLSQNDGQAGLDTINAFR